MTNEHPITPSLEVVNNWVDMLSSRSDYAVFTTAVQWGADLELEACCEWLDAGLRTPYVAIRLRSDRRSKPPSLKEQALAALHAVTTGANDIREQHQDLDTIRKALEALPND